MKREIEIAMRLLLKSDTTIPPDGRIELAVDIVKGQTRKRSAIVRIKELDDILHVSGRTLRNLMKNGKLNRVVGKNGRMIGVSRESLVEYLRGEARGITNGRRIAELHSAIDRSFAKEDSAKTLKNGPGL